MTDQTLHSPAPRRTATRSFRNLKRGQAVIVAALVFAALMALNAFLSPYPLSYFDVSFLASGGATTAIAAAGQTLVILSGGFDLSAGAVVSLVNAVLATSMDPSNMEASVPLWTAIGIAIGMGVGAVNGFFVAVMRLQPIVVTLAVMFIVQGLTLLIMAMPGGFVSPTLASTYLGDTIPGLLPAPVTLLLVLVALWLWLKRTAYGVTLYAVGSDPEAARSTGLRTRTVTFATYVLAGGLYGLAGVFVSAQTGSGDPLAGNALLLPTFAAVVIGGTRLGGGKGGVLGTILGAYILMIVVNLLLSLNVSAYYSTIAESAVLLIAVLAGSLSKDSTLSLRLRDLSDALSARRKGWLVTQRPAEDRRLAFTRPSDTAPRLSFMQKYGHTLRHALPAWLCLALVLIATQAVLGNVFTGWRYWDSLLVLSSFLAILALGQGAVILTGGLDLSLPWCIALSGVLLTGLVGGQDMGLLTALPVVFAVAAVIGLANGLGVVALGLSPIVVTLAMNGILQGAALIWSGGTPAGFAPPVLRWMMTGKVMGITPVILFMVVFTAFAILLLGRTAFGRRVYAVGNSELAARLSGVRTGRVIVSVYILSALCAALVGVLLAGFSGQASLGMGDDYLLPSIAVVVVGGALITGGRGHYAGMLGGALMLTAMQTLLAGTALPFAFRSVFFGLVILMAVIALRE
ncbi:ABC transporter permease [Allosediminivita pacifica]|uniref:Ribose transport system permease protein n=1 Tax=Allosediminivita pacifica TaxID=1267769 RepID=A0A2T6ATP4_9RHOB|nr:ABC transporter permease [Allosediminivita pacifica]PTX47198.1 ribose transport system permease protein [Allosediminivita pacifica]GGB09485.1 ABC transporter permease [Allosediminivita pacifica]